MCIRDRITVNDFDKSSALRHARSLHRMGFNIYATKGTAEFLNRANIPVTTVGKVSDHGDRSFSTVGLIEAGKIGLVINTPLGQQSYIDGHDLRSAAIKHNVPILTTLSATQAAITGIKALREEALTVRSLQDHYAKTA